MMLVLASLFGALIVGGGVMVVSGVNRTNPTIPKLSTRMWTKSVDRVGRKQLILVLASLIVGVVAAIWSGWGLLVLILPATTIALPVVLSAPRDRDLELLQAVDRWLRSLASLLATGRSIADAIRVSARQAPTELAPSLRRLVTRLDERWTIEQALLEMAEELDSPDTDAVLAALALAAQRGGTGAKITLEALADNLQDRLRALREISTERAKPRFVVRQVTLITVTVLGLALLFGGSFFAPFGTPLGQVLLIVLVSAYFGSLLMLRRMTLPRARQRILGRLT
jgi:tight adherence protein B